MLRGTSLLKPVNRAKLRCEYLKAIRDGDLVRPTHCSRCGKRSPNIHGHHKDYLKPLEVVWLCSSCHITLHHMARKISSGALPAILLVR